MESLVKRLEALSTGLRRQAYSLNLTAESLKKDVPISNV